MMTRILRLAAGIVLVSLGVLWALQGADLVHLKPILCLANCEPVIGRSPTWLIVGLITIVVGAALLFWKRAVSTRTPDRP